MMRALGHTVVTCCDMVEVKNRTNAHPLAQHCCTYLAKRLQHQAPSFGRDLMVSLCNNVAHVWTPCCDVLQHVGRCWLKIENCQIFHATFEDVS